MSNQIFLNSPLYFNQDATIYGQYLNANISGFYDYTFSINVASMLGGTGDLTSLFKVATYTQNSANYDNVDVNIILQNSTTLAGWGSTFNNQPLTQVVIGQSNKAFGTFKTTPDNVGDVLLEVIAHKLFGHAQARSAISNDNLFFSHDAQIWDHLSNAFTQQNYRNDVFNQYVGIGRYNAASSNGSTYNATTGNYSNTSQYNDSDGIVNFNFSNLTFDYPLWVAGSLILDSSLTSAEKSLLLNGPNVGGTSLANGVYNVPILIRFHQ